MTRYLLDTNIISDLIRNPQGRAAKRIARVGDLWKPLLEKRGRFNLAAMFKSQV